MDYIEVEEHLRLVIRQREDRYTREIEALILEREALRKELHQRCPKCLAERFDKEAR